jgi:signal transduction histidine kinase
MANGDPLPGGMDSVTSPSALQESFPGESRLFAKLLQAGTLVLDDGDGLRFASAGASELFGVADEAALREHWSDVCAQLRIGQWPRALSDGDAYYGRADVTTPAGPRAIRFEMHAMSDAGRVLRAVLVRDRAHLLPGDGALLFASEAVANRHVLIGLVHAAKGPLNNFNLTLALLTGSFAPGAASPPTADMIARRTRYVDVLKHEATRLAGYIDELHALTLAHDGSRETIDLGVLSQDCTRVLRHGATMRDIKLELDVPDGPVTVDGDPHLVRLALLSFAISILDLTSPGGRVGWRVAHAPGSDSPSVEITTSQPALPPELVAALFRLSCTAESVHSSAIAARLIIEAQGGDVSLQDATRGTPGFLLRMPGHA